MTPHAEIPPENDVTSGTPSLMQFISLICHLFLIFTHSRVIAKDLTAPWQEKVAQSHPKMTPSFLTKALNCLTVARMARVATLAPSCPKMTPTAPLLHVFASGRTVMNCGKHLSTMIMRGWVLSTLCQRGQCDFLSMISQHLCVGEWGKGEQQLLDNLNKHKSHFGIAHIHFAKEQLKLMTPKKKGGGGLKPSSKFEGQQVVYQLRLVHSRA